MWYPFPLCLNIEVWIALTEHYRMGPSVRHFTAQHNKFIIFCASVLVAIFKYVSVLDDLSVLNAINNSVLNKSMLKSYLYLPLQLFITVFVECMTTILK